MQQCGSYRSSIALLKNSMNVDNNDNNDIEASLTVPVWPFAVIFPVKIKPSFICNFILPPPRPPPPNGGPPPPLPHAPGEYNPPYGEVTTRTPFPLPPLPAWQAPVEPEGEYEPAPGK